MLAELEDRLVPYAAVIHWRRLSGYDGRPGRACAIHTGTDGEFDLARCELGSVHVPRGKAPLDTPAPWLCVTYWQGTWRREVGLVLQ